VARLPPSNVAEVARLYPHPMTTIDTIIDFLLNKRSQNHVNELGFGFVFFIFLKNK
jgi:hypothetical protein